MPQVLGPVLYCCGYRATGFLEKVNTSMSEQARALALVGMPGSGKSVCADHLAARGYYKFRFGQIVVDEVARRGLELTPQHEQIVREDLRKQGGINAIATLALPELKKGLETHTSIIIDGLYGFGEYELLHAEFGAAMVVVAVVADRDRRYARLANRPERPLSPEEAEQRDIREIRHLEKGGPIAIADYTLLNNGPVDELLAALDGLLARLKMVP